MRKTDYAAIGETLYTTVLPNGLPVYVLPKPGYLKTFAMFAVQYGGVDRRFTCDGEELDTPAGIAHYLEHKMFDTPDGSALVTLNATGASPNAYTSPVMTAYHFECTDRFEENLRTLLSFVSTPYFTQESVDKERGIIAQEIRMYEDTPEYVVYTNLMKCLFARHPLRDSVAGTVESIAEITPETLYRCHRIFYRPSNMVLCVVGDVDPESVTRIAEEILPTEREDIPAHIYDADEDLTPCSERCAEHMEVSAPLFMIGGRLGPAKQGADALRERIASGLALRCLCGSSSPFYLRHYSSGLLNASFDFDADFIAGQGIVCFSGDTSGDPEEILRELRGEIDRVRRDGLDPALFERQRRASFGGRIRALSQFGGLAGSLASGCFAGYQPLDAFSLLDSVTCAEVSAWVRENLVPERLAMSVVYPKEA